jgi:GGDEF domain-containing protein
MRTTRFSGTEGAVVTIDAPCRHVLYVGPESRRTALVALLDGPCWESAHTHSLQQARFVLYAYSPDVVVIDCAIAEPGWSEALAWLAREVAAPLVLCGDAPPHAVVEALKQRAIWLPGDLFRHGAILNAILEQAVRLGGERSQAASERAALIESQTRIDRLLALLWEATPAEGQTRWFTQRYMLERLDEELARSQRYGVPLSVVLGEVRPEPGERLLPEDASRLARWIAECIGKGKRRCDVAGQYGLHGFMLLLPQSSADQAQEACNRMRRLLTDAPHGGLPAVHACFGLASAPTDVSTVQGLLRRAEERLEQETGDGSH